MKTHHHIALLAAIITTNLSADTIILKTGKKYDGRVISEDEKSYFCEIQVTKSIKDERRFAKDQVREIIRESAEHKELEKITKLVPTPDRMAAAAYDKRITATKAFIAKYPKSKHLDKAKTILATLRQEQKTIAKGGLKLDGQLIPADDIEANAYDIHARILYHDIKALAAAGHYQKALRKWETLKNDYQLTTQLNNLEARTAKRKAALESMSESDRQRAESLLAKKQKAYAALVEKEKTQLRTQWLTINPSNKEALEHNLRSIDTLANSLHNQRTTQTTPAGPVFRDAWSALAGGDLQEAEKLIQELKSMQIPEKYTSPLATRLKEKQAARAAAEKAAKLRAEQQAAEKAAAEKKADQPEANK